jgi:hypothetical protein
VVVEVVLVVEARHLEVVVLEVMLEMEPLALLTTVGVEVAVVAHKIKVLLLVAMAVLAWSLLEFQKPVLQPSQVV